MNENIHNDDEFFRKAYDNFEEEPSPEVWEKLNAQLDKKDAMFYRNRSVVWKRSAFALLLLLMFFVSYEYVFKTKETAGKDIISNAIPKKINSRAEIKDDKSSKHKSVLPSVHQTDESDSSSAAVKHETIIDSAASQSLSKASQRSFKEHNQKIVVQLSANKKIKKPSEEISDVAFVKDHKNQSDKSVKQFEIFGNRPNETFTKKSSKQSNPTSDFYYKQNNNLRNKRDSQIVNQDMASANKIQKDSADVPTVDSSQFALNVSGEKVNTTGEQVTTIAKDKTALTQSKIDSNATVSIAATKKSTIKINHLFKPHWSFSPYISADYSGQLLDDDDKFREPNGRDDRDELEERENEQFGYSAGVLSRYQFSKKWLVKSGLVLSNQSKEINPQTLYAAANSQDVKFKYVTSSGYAYIDPSFNPSPAIGDSITSQRAEQHLTYLNIPLQVSYLVHMGKKLTLLPGIGFTTNLLLNSKITTEVRGDDDDDNDNVSLRGIKGLDKVNFSILADAELQYQFSSKWSFMMVPSFKYAINPITKEHVVKTYPYSFGLGFGVTYGL